MKIKASAIKTGDIIKASTGDLIALYPNPSTPGRAHWIVHNCNRFNTDALNLMLDDELDVVSQPLTLPMQHADEAFRILRHVRDALGGKASPLTSNYLKTINTVLDKVDPPKPTTMDEMEEMLKRVLEGKPGVKLEADIKELLKRHVSTKLPEPPEGWKMANPFGPSYSEFILKGGWTDATLKDNGYLVKV